MNWCMFLTIICFVYLARNCNFSEAGDKPCKDLHPKCPEWATWLDECYENAGYMLGNCSNSCHQCSCGDNHPKCGEWAKSGECTKNPLYMQLHCRQACELCKLVVPEAKSSIKPEFMGETSR